MDSRYFPRMYQVVESLSTGLRPAGCKKFSGSEYTYLISVGNYRVIYDVEDGKPIVVVKKIRARLRASDR